MASEWFYQAMGKQVGPISSAELLDLARRGTVTEDTQVKKAPDGAWVPANRVQGLFSVSGSTTRPQPVTATPAGQPPTKACPYCGEQIMAVAIKCRYCGSDLSASEKTPASVTGPVRTPADCTITEGSGHVAKWLRPYIRLTMIAWLVFALVFPLIVTVSEIADWNARRTQLGAGVVGRLVAAWLVYPIIAGLGLLAIWLYFLPAIEAKRHNHPHYFGVLTLNFGLGWTFLGWLGALVWARMIAEGGNCWRCNARLTGFPLVCQFCQVELAWDQGRSRPP